MFIYVIIYLSLNFLRKNSNFYPVILFQILYPKTCLLLQSQLVRFCNGVTCDKLSSILPRSLLLDYRDGNSNGWDHNTNNRKRCRIMRSYDIYLGRLFWVEKQLKYTRLAIQESVERQVCTNHMEMHDEYHGPKNVLSKTLSSLRSKIGPPCEIKIYAGRIQVQSKIMPLK